MVIHSSIGRGRELSPDPTGLSADRRAVAGTVRVFPQAARPVYAGLVRMQRMALAVQCVRPVGDKTLR